ncbi:hypothetical protein ACNF42_03055 [Cuniculiplasma sp. SKW3]|uniref:hypothetical protein n=1 Tax=Cuniculiplasma sp. SKW3 TaxID=3400170 RepID=UPI003FD5FA5B
MKIADRIVVLGDNEAAVMVANKIVQRAKKGDVEVIILGKNKRVEFIDSNPFIPVSLIDQSSSIRSMESVLRMSVQFISDEPVTINLKDNNINTKNGRLIRYDYLILADYAFPDTSKIVGYNEDARSIETIQGSLQLKEDLANFKKGEIVIYHDATSKYSPLNSVNLAVNMFTYFDSKELGKDIKITCAFGGDSPTGMNEMDSIIENTLKSLGINMVKNFDLSAINVKNKELQSRDGKTIKYDIPVIFSPSSYYPYIDKSSFPKADSGNIEVNIKDLTLKGFENIYVMGFAGKNFTNYWKLNRTQADFISARIAHEVSGYPEPDVYSYKYDIVLIKGRESASDLLVDMEGKVIEGRASRTDYLVGLYSQESFFGTYAMGFI